MATVPARSEAARAPITDLPPSDALSILANGPESFVGRKIGVLTADGADRTSYARCNGRRPQKARSWS